jgi:hypothetical protein
MGSRGLAKQMMVRQVVKVEVPEQIPMLPTGTSAEVVAPRHAMPD